MVATIVIASDGFKTATLKIDQSGLSIHINNKEIKTIIPGNVCEIIQSLNNHNDKIVISGVSFTLIARNSRSDINVYYRHKEKSLYWQFSTMWVNSITSS